MPIDGTLLAAVAAIHDSCFDAGDWAKALGLVASLLDSNGVVLALEDRRHGFATSFEAQTAPEARTHLRHLFDKTGTGRQVELVNLIRAVVDG